LMFLKGFVSRGYESGAANFIKDYYRIVYKLRIAS
jgi:hypothetical protein